MAWDIFFFLEILNRKSPFNQFKLVLKYSIVFYLLEILNLIYQLEIKTKKFHERLFISVS